MDIRSIQNMAGGYGFLLILLVTMAGSVLLPMPWNIVFAMGISMFLIVAAVLTFVPDLLKTDKIKANIRKNGKSARAKIIKIKETGMYGKFNEPYLVFHLEVMPPDRPAYHAQTRPQTYSMLEIMKLQPGNIVGVMYDPGNPENVVVHTPEDARNKSSSGDQNAF